MTLEPFVQRLRKAAGLIYVVAYNSQKWALTTKNQPGLEFL